MLKRLNKICKVLLLALTFVLGSTGFALAAENETHISTESMEIRTEGKTGLRTISAIDKAYLEQMKAEGKGLLTERWQYLRVRWRQPEENFRLAEAMR